MSGLLDAAPLPVATTGAVWRYKAIYGFHDESIGYWSDITSISAMG